MEGESRSILARIEADGQEVPRLKLLDAAEDRDLPVKLETGQLRGTGRYEIVGEIARGGVGQILKGHDVDLGRDVALKVIREGHRGNRELVQRVVEEAQIGGQLQHPGVVPVYELGIASGGRPYFAMKLVKGETLASLLADRDDPTRESRRFLVIFESICRTMAYAHARGVVHRDLKPSNVMIGSFGEVQIVDWGFAKVLSRGGVADERRARREERDITRIATLRTAAEGSESLPGSVMGTPAYMPPEQALGHVEDLDEASDVFALGAILTEILTGKPPYTGEPRDLLTMAAQATLDDAHARLGACGADPELVALTKSCLAPLRKDRPRDGAALAAQVSGRLAAAEERARQSEIAAVESREAAARDQSEAAEVRARAEAERAAAEGQRARAEQARAKADEARATAKEARRARSQTLAIAAVILLAVVAGSAAFILYDRGRSEGARRAAAAVSDAIREATTQRGDGAWLSALATARSAVEVAEDGGATDEVRRRAEAFLAEVAEGAEAERIGEERSERERALLSRLDQLRVAGRGDLSGIRDEETEPVRLALAAALVEIGEEESPARADELDPDPLRQKIRTSLAQGDRAALAALAREVDPKEAEVGTTVLLAVSLARLGDASSAAELLRGAWWEHPSEFWVNFHLGRLLTLLPEPAWSEASRHYSAAVALRPERKEIWTLVDRCVSEARKR